MKTTHTYKTRTFLLLPKKEPTYQSINEKTLSATDVLAPTTMKNAAKCDTSCELRNPVSHQNFERILHFLRGVCLLECLFIPTSPNFLVWCTCVDCWFCHEIITLRWTHEAYFYPSCHWTRQFVLVPCGVSQTTRRRNASFTPCGLISQVTRFITNPDHPIGPPISQEYPLNLSI